MKSSAQKRQGSAHMDVLQSLACWKQIQGQCHSSEEGGMDMQQEQEQDVGAGIVCDLYRKITFLSEKNQNVSLKLCFPFWAPGREDP